MTMTKLTDLFQTPQLTSLLRESDTELVLSCLDPQTGAVTRVTVKADMVTVPNEALLYVAVEDIRVDESAAGCGYGGDADVVLDDADCESELLPPTWAITPQGQEIDLQNL